MNQLADDSQDRQDQRDQESVMVGLLNSKKPPVASRFCRHTDPPEIEPSPRATASPAAHTDKWASIVKFALPPRPRAVQLCHQFPGIPGRRDVLEPALRPGDEPRLRRRAPARAACLARRWPCRPRAPRAPGRRAPFHRQASRLAAVPPTIGFGVDNRYAVACSSSARTAEARKRGGKALILPRLGDRHRAIQIGNVYHAAVMPL